MNRPSFAWKLYIAAFYLFLFAPLLIVAIFAFNASPFPSPPWRGFTLEWFTGSGSVFGKPGILMDPIWLDSIGNSFKVAVPVALLAVLIGTVNAWVLERAEFPGKTVLAMMMLWPLVIPGVVLGISILAFFSRVANGLEDWLQTDLDMLRPGLPLVVLGQLSFILTIATLIIAARLRKFDRSLEEAAFDLGASRARVLRTVTLPFLSPALIGAGLVALLMSFENFNTTLMLVGSDAPLPITMYGQMREGATPAINAVSLLLMLGVGGIASVFALTSKAGR
ncbi:spermidine/putrescine transport system permease protein [Microvirga flocculans]|uniref:Spermidine/putrescine transport system permease protein n=1 Tax=Microvirga flocculans TaxID=217168 RepID=A0A7W6N7V6_9HYPH|nr:ABC transporter permease [Microvirga flocculans]MBB4040498.1 spermidine/putrescine transport system permease protein [Microvirga flocculans]